MQENPLPPPAAPPRPRLVRSDNRTAAGVAGGVAEYFDIDPTLVRIGFVAATFAGGLGAALYLAGWLLIPERNGTTILDTKRNEVDPWVFFGIALLVFVVVFGISVSDGDGVLLPLLLIGGGVFLLNQRQRHAPSPQPDGAPTGTFNPQPASAFVSPPEQTEIQPYEPPPAAPPREPRPPAIVTRAALSLAVLVVAAGVAVGAAGWSSYHATLIAAGVLATFGIGLVVSAFIGRGRGLAFLAFLALLATVTTASAETAIDAGTGERNYRPQSLADVQTQYELGFGELIVDLRDIALPAGETLEVEVDLSIGSAVVYVPSDATVEVTSSTKIGETRIFGEDEAGLGNEIQTGRDGSDEAGTIIIDLEVGIGEGVVRHGR